MTVIIIVVVIKYLSARERREHQLFLILIANLSTSPQGFLPRAQLFPRVPATPSPRLGRPRGERLKAESGGVRGATQGPLPCASTNEDQQPPPDLYLGPTRERACVWVGRLLETGPPVKTKLGLRATIPTRGSQGSGKGREAWRPPQDPALAPGLLQQAPF